MNHSNSESLYLLDFGDFVKIGHSSSLRQRLNSLDGIIGESPNLEKSLVWIFERNAALFLENSIVKKYRHSLYEHPKIKKEVFSSTSKELIISDIESVIRQLQINTKRQALSEILEYRTGKRNAYSYHLTKSLKKKFENEIRVNPYGII